MSNSRVRRRWWRRWRAPSRRSASRSPRRRWCRPAARRPAAARARRRTVQQPGDLGAGEVGIEQQAGDLGHLRPRGPAARSALARPRPFGGPARRWRWWIGLPGRLVPGHHRLALVGDRRWRPRRPTSGRPSRCASRSTFDARLEDLLGVVLDPAIGGIELVAAAGRPRPAPCRLASKRIARVAWWSPGRAPGSAVRPLAAPPPRLSLVQWSAAFKHVFTWGPDPAWPRTGRGT